RADQGGASARARRSAERRQFQELHLGALDRGLRVRDGGDELGCADEVPGVTGRNGYFLGALVCAARPNQRFLPDSFVGVSLTPHTMPPPRLHTASLSVRRQSSCGTSSEQLACTGPRLSDGMSGVSG